MAEPQTAEEQPTKKRSKWPLLLGMVGAIGLGGGGFFATYTGILGGSGHETAEAYSPESQTVAFVPVPPMVVSLGQASQARHLRFAAEMEVDKGREAEVGQLMPRILDVLNGYLRAVEIAEFAEPPALVRLRAQMLRRVQIVTGEGRVRDLLITEFVLN